MNGYDEIISLMQTLATSFRVLPDKAAEKLNALTEEERDELLHLLKLVSSVKAQDPAPEPNRSLPSAEPAAVPSAANRTEASSAQTGQAVLPEPDTYDAIDERSAICRGCPSGCELRWDDRGNCTGFSCIIGQETAEMLAEYYRAG